MAVCSRSLREEREVREVGGGGGGGIVCVGGGDSVCVGGGGGGGEIGEVKRELGKVTVREGEREVKE